MYRGDALNNVEIAVLQLESKEETPAFSAVSRITVSITSGSNTIAVPNRSDLAESIVGVTGSVVDALGVIRMVGCGSLLY
ncbi:hypothetical protein MK139_08535 [bacterium]|nr:hypothetical protein [Gemmatimonadota bacterium]MCH2664380.1 hypothetical protein [bacterium]HCK10143.1 hypothetical protein [Candidatus Latescibacterota bacterium]